MNQVHEIHPRRILRYGAGFEIWPPMKSEEPGNHHRQKGAQGLIVLLPASFSFQNTA
jgi:hypothetical protein